MPPTDDHRDAAGSPEFLVVGAFVASHGVRGEARLRILTEFPERLQSMRSFRLRFPDGRLESRAVLGLRPHKGDLLVQLEGASTMDDALAVRGAEVVVPIAEAVPLPPGRYYEHQIIGLRVLTAEGEELGTISDVVQTASNDVYVAGPYLIPATRDAVMKLAPEEGILVVRSKAYLAGEEVR